MPDVYKAFGALTATLLSDREVRLTRTFRAPRQLIWDAHTQPALIRCWLPGPSGWTMSVCDVDLRVGGMYRYEWHNGSGQTMTLSGTYREIEAPRRIVDVEPFDDDPTHGEVQGTLTLENAGNGTELTLDLLYGSKSARDMVFESLMMKNMEAGYARMDAITA